MTDPTVEKCMDRAAFLLELARNDPGRTQYMEGEIARVLRKRSLEDLGELCRFPGLAPRLLHDLEALKFA